MTQKQDSLESFAKRIMTKLAAGGATDSLERLICRMLTGDDVKTAAFLANKVVEWRYGKPKETLRIEERKPIESGTGFYRTTDTTPTRRPN